MVQQARSRPSAQTFPNPLAEDSLQEVQESTIGGLRLRARARSYNQSH